MTALAEYVPRQPLPPIRGLEIKGLNDVRFIERIRILETASLAVRYSDNHYERNVATGFPRFNQLAFYHDIMVGCCTCRLEMVEEPDTYRLYVMTICTLKPYRRMGIGSRMLEAILHNVHNETQIHITGVFLNVQASSESALAFYKKFNFTQIELVKDYYVDLDCNDSYALGLSVSQPLLEKKKRKK
eukprot:gene8605-6041_t